MSNNMANLLQIVSEPAVTGGLLLLYDSIVGKGFSNEHLYDAVLLYYTFILCFYLLFLLL